MDRVFIDHVIEGIHNQVKDSTEHHFANNEYFQELPPTIQKRLAKHVLQRQFKTFHFFFKDYHFNYEASDSLIVQVIT